MRPCLPRILTDLEWARSAWGENGCGLHRRPPKPVREGVEKAKKGVGICHRPWPLALGRFRRRVRAHPAPAGDVSLRNEGRDLGSVAASARFARAHATQHPAARQQVRQQTPPPRHPPRRRIQTRLEPPRVPLQFHRHQEQMPHQRPQPPGRFAFGQVQELQRLEQIPPKPRQRVETPVRVQVNARGMRQVQVAPQFAQHPFLVPFQPVML